MLSSSLYAMIKLSKTSSPQKLFDYDCVTLYSNSVWLILSNYLTIKSSVKHSRLLVANSMGYSVMQSDGNRFCWNVVLDSLNMAYRHEDSVLDQNYEKQKSRNACLLFVICYFKSDWRKCIFKVIQLRTTRNW